MALFAELTAEARAAGLPFVIIGGNAVVAHGYPRQTNDFDFMVHERDRRAWDTLIVSRGYTAHHINHVFHMYASGDPDLPPVDLMVVDDSTFQKIRNQSVQTEIASARVAVPALPHLIALKLHALRYGHAHRRARDEGDVVQLLVLNHVDLALPEYREIFARYATQPIRERIYFLLGKSVGPESSDPRGGSTDLSPADSGGSPSSEPNRDA